MKKIILGLLIFIFTINVTAKELTFDVCKEGNCDCKDLEACLVRAEDYDIDDNVNILLKDDYQVYEIESHDISSKVNIINNKNKKLDLIEIKGIKKANIKLKNTFSIYNRFNNVNGEVDISNVNFSVEDFRGTNNTLIKLTGDFILNNININGYVEWEDYLRNLNNLDNFSYDEVYAVYLKDSKIDMDGVNIYKFIRGIINDNSDVTINNSNLTDNSYSIYNNSGRMKLNYTRSNSIINGLNKKAKIDITGSSEFLNTIKIHSKEPSKYSDYKDFSNIINLNNSISNFDLEITKNIKLDGKGLSLKRLFPVIDGIDYNNLKWDATNKLIARVDNNMIIPIKEGTTDVTTEIKDKNIKYTVHVKVSNKSKSSHKALYILIIVIIIMVLGSIKSGKKE